MRYIILKITNRPAAGGVGLWTEVGVGRTRLGLCNGGLADVGRERPRGSHHCQGVSQTRLQMEMKPTGV